MPTGDAAPDSLAPRGWLDRPAPVAALYLLLTLVMTFPLAARFTTHVPAGATDLWQNHWNFWWWKTSLLDLRQSPYFTRHLFHPGGASMAFYTHSPFNMLLALPVAVVFGYGAAHNFCVLVAVWLSGFAAWLLAREVTGEGRAALLAGLIYAFFPQHLEQTLEHLNLFTIQFIPLVFYFWLRMARGGGRGNWIGLGVAFALNALASWHLGLMLTLLLAPAAAVQLARAGSERRRLALDLLRAGVLASVLMLPAVLPMIRGLAGGETWFQKPTENKGIDAAFLLLPSHHHPIWGRLTAGWYGSRQAYSAAGFLCFLGFTPLALAGIALARRAKGWALWSALFAVSLVLALGARPFFAGRMIESASLPFALFEHLPVLRFLRVANRWLVFASLGLAVLAALGAAAPRFRSRGAFALLCGLILLEFLWLPYPTRSAAVSPFYDQVASTSGGAVLDIPFTTDSSTVANMRAQTVHGRPIAGGYLSTTPDDARRALARTPALADLMGFAPRLRRPVDPVRLAELGFEYVILHKDRTRSAWQRARSASDPGDLYGRRIINATGGMDDRDFARVRRAMERAIGPADFEDATIVVFALGQPVRGR